MPSRGLAVAGHALPKWGVAAACVGFALMGAAGRAASQPASSASALTAQARAALDQRLLNEAVDLARQALEADRTLAAAWKVMGDARARRGHRSRQDKERAIEAYAQYQLLSHDASVQGAIERLYLEGDLPRWLAKDTLPVLPVHPKADTVTVRRSIKPGDADLRIPVCVTTEMMYPPGTTLEHPRYGAGFNRVVCGYITDANDPEGRLYERARVYFTSLLTSKSKVDLQPIAVNTLLLVLRLMCYQAAYLAPDGLSAPDNQAPLELWLVEDREPGGEQRRGEMAVFGAGAARSPLEWIRLVCHEFGHYALPPIGVYTEPEPWANGLLGEYLFPVWLWRNQGGGTVAWGDDAVDLTPFLNSRCGTLLQAFFAQMPDGNALYKRDATGVNHLIGLGLYTDLVLGPDGLGRALAEIGEPIDTEGLMQRIQRAMESRGTSIELPGRLYSQPESPLPAGAEYASLLQGPVQIPGGKSVIYWVYLGRGPCSLALASDPMPRDTAPTKVTIDVQGRSPGTAVLDLAPGAGLCAGDLGPKAPGWYRVVLSHDNAHDPLVLHRLVFVRSGADNE